ncbi:hypothetical protein CAL29_30075 [Bordetella genomosp. 10]|uniref:ABC transporter substrate-binding protein n=1 Tax=Bordetella genomosp. 10 TaxID=1416804 RepID=A0A261S419_9BORD|nr:tripartite tricarboxylate transporter substrate binding protein [Bordetella genomosp. 10]OZI32084.1 hypothetical protein CAL29_30075 [Bordetella genomosp. 10]
MKTTGYRRWWAPPLALLFGLLAVQPAAHAKGEFPSQPVRIVVPYPAGGTTDFAARLIAEQLTRRSGQSFIVENKPGATGSIGAMDVLNARHDGYTLLMNDTSFAIVPSLSKSLKWHPKTDFIPISTVAISPVVFVVAADSPFHTLQDFIAAAKAKPGALEYGAGGYGGSTHLAFEVFNDQAGIKVQDIPYKGAGESLVGLMGGSVKAMIAAAPSLLGQIKSGKIRALAVSGPKRLPVLPDVPTFAEAGLPSYDVEYWFGLVAPKNTPPQVVARLHELLTQSLADPRTQESLQNVGAFPGGISSKDFAALIASEIDRWSKVAKEAGIQPN